MFHFLQETVSNLSHFVGYDGEPLIVLVPSKGLYMESGCTVLSCASESIVFRLRKQVITLCGKALQVSYFDKGSIFIAGNIEKVEVNAF